MRELIEPETTQVQLPEAYRAAAPFLNQDRYASRDLPALEVIMAVCDLYLWLQNWFPESFQGEGEREAIAVKEKCAGILEAVLTGDGKIEQDVDQLDNE